MALSKKDYEKVLSAEAGVPVFLTDAEYEGVTKPRAAKPAAKSSGDGFVDPFEKVPELAAAERARKASPDAWTTQKGVTYNNTHGRPSAASSAALKDKAKAAHASAYGPGDAPWGSETAQPKAWGASMPAPHPNATGASTASAAPGYIGKLPMPGAPVESDAPKMTYTPPPVYGQPTSVGKPFKVEQYDYDGYDFGLPLAGDPLKASAPPDTVYAKQIAGNPEFDPWAAPIAINEAYAAKAKGTAAVDAVKKGY